MEKEIWKAKENYEDYQVSNLGRIKSLKCNRVKILKQGVDKYGYHIVSIHNYEGQKTFAVHRLVWDAFSDTPRQGRIIQVDHKNHKKSDNRFANLQLLKARQNSHKHYLRESVVEDKTSKYVGVNYNKKLKLWVSKITIGNKRIHLGYFKNEIEAHNYYQQQLENLNNGKKVVAKPQNFSSKYKGVSWNKHANQWQSYIRINGKRKHLGYFKDEKKAHNAYQKALKNIQTPLSKLK